MSALDWTWFAFIFAFGCCVGSFLNVVIYRLPRDKSLVRPPSACPFCGKPINWYDNIPLVSWIILLAKCRYCKAAISPRYFIIELLTGSAFVGMFFLYFHTDLRSGTGGFLKGGWYIYLISIILLSFLIAVSAIDLELLIIPLVICWFITALGLIGSALGVYIIDPAVIREYSLLPSASAKTASLAVGAAVGLVISLVLLETNLIKRSYDSEEPFRLPEKQDESHEEPDFNHYSEISKEIIFLLPIVICSVAAYLLSQKIPAIRTWWLDFSQKPLIAGFLGSLWGYFTGCGIIWAARILGTLGFRKEAMGLGDVHLMGAAGTIIGPLLVVVAFFIAPFFGLGWAGVRAFFKKSRQIPYGPFLSLGILTVMIFHDRIVDYLNILFYY